MTVTQDTYRHIIERATHDERVSMGDFVFLVRLVFLLDKTGQDYIHLPYRQLLEEMNLGMGTVGNGIDNLIKCKYLKGELAPKLEGGRQSWLLYLADMPEPEIVEPKKPLATHEYEYGGLRFTVIVDKVVTST